MLTDLRELYKKYSSVENASLQWSMAAKEQAKQGPSRSVKALFLNNIRLLDYDLQDEKKSKEERAAIEQRCLTTFVERRLGKNIEGSDVLRDFICTIGERGKLRPEQSKSSSKPRGREDVHRFEEGANEEALLVELSPTTQRNGSSPVLQSKPNTKNTLTHSRSVWL